MSPRSTRRKFLQAGAALVPPLVAGCSQFPDFGSSETSETSHPDEGTDSYGIELRSQIDAAATLSLETSKPFEDEQIWSKEVTLNSDSTVVYDSVLTEEHGEQAFTAELTAVDDEDGLDKTRSDGFLITPGSEDAPDARRFEVLVHVVTAEHRYYDVSIIDPENVQG